LADARTAPPLASRPPPWRSCCARPRPSGQSSGGQGGGAGPGSRGRRGRGGVLYAADRRQGAGTWGALGQGPGFRPRVEVSLSGSGRATWKTRGCYPERGEDVVGVQRPSGSLGPRLHRQTLKEVRVPQVRKRRCGEASRKEEPCHLSSRISRRSAWHKTVLFMGPPHPGSFPALGNLQRVDTAR
jgi:hypothetical protein